MDRLKSQNSRLLLQKWTFFSDHPLITTMKVALLLVAALAVFALVAADSCPAGTCESGQTCKEI
jgi:hypothetical protein